MKSSDFLGKTKKSEKSPARTLQIAPDEEEMKLDSVFLKNISTYLYVWEVELKDASTSSYEKLKTSQFHYNDSMPWTLRMQ